MGLIKTIRSFFEEKENPSLRLKRDAIFKDQSLEEWIERSKVSVEALAFLMKIRGNVLVSKDYATRAIPEDIPEDRILFLNKKTALAIEQAAGSENDTLRKYALEQLWHIEEIGGEKKFTLLKNGVEDGILNLEGNYHDIFTFGGPFASLFKGPESIWAERGFAVLLESFKKRIEYVKKSPISRGKDEVCLHIIFYLKRDVENFPQGAEYLQEIAEDPVLSKTKIAKEIYN